MNQLLVFAVVAFAAVFLVVGIFRVVEFTDIGLKPATQYTLMAAHVVGCILFSMALALTEWQILPDQKKITSCLFFGGVLLLFPIHIYLGIKRKIRASSSNAQ
jgi:uncharacterized membrane protein